MTEEKFQVKIATMKLNVRAGAGFEHKTVKSISLGGIYTIVKTVTDKDGNEWGLLAAFKKEENGWINLGYTQKIYKKGKKV